MSVQDNSSESDNEDGNDLFNEELIQFGSIDFSNLSKRLQTESQNCLCKVVENKESALNLMSEMVNFDIKSDKHNCVLDNIMRCFNVCSKKTSIEDPSRLAFTDLFYRLRHEILFKCLMLSINMPEDKSDIPFSDFGIDSKRTPDFICQKGKTLIIIEVAASSNFENASRMKGSDDLGFESKYQRELDILLGLSVQHVYMPLIFDMSDKNNKSYLDQIKIASNYFKINSQFEILLNVMVQSLCNITNSIKDFTVPASMYLFSTFIPVEKDHKSLEFLYHKNKVTTIRSHYKEFYVSIPTYRKVYNNWHRIPTFLQRLNKSGNNEKKKFTVVLDIKTNKINFEENNRLGVTIKEFEEIFYSNNKPEFFKKTYISLGDKTIPAIDSETGVLFREKVNDHLNDKDFDLSNYEDLELITNHEPVIYDEKNKFPLKKYQQILDQHYLEKYHSLHYDNDYENTLLNSIKENDKLCFEDINNDIYIKTRHGLLSDLTAESINIKEEMEKIELMHIKENSKNDLLPLKEFRMKNPFIMPLADLCSSDYCPLEYKNIGFIDSLISEIQFTNPFTTLVLEKIKSVDYTFYDRPKQQSSHLKELIEEKKEKSREITKIVRELLKNKNSKERNEMMNKDFSIFIENKGTKDQYNKLKKEVSRLDKAINLRTKEEGLKREIGLVRLPNKNKKTEIGERFLKEMEHFKSKKHQSTFKGVGIINSFIRDHENNYNIFKKIQNTLPDFRGVNSDLMIDDYVSDDSKLLKDLKTKALSDYKVLLNSVKDSFLGHASAFVSRLGHSLLYYSQLPFNSDYIRVDNLGYNCCLLFVRGGKKIFKSKSSKLFRIFYPINECISPWIQGDVDRPSSSQIINFNGRIFVLSPWLMWHESILTDSLSFYTRVVSFTVLNLEPTFSFREQISKVVFNIMLAFHNRRQSEVLLSNMRYILLSTLGDFTGIIGVLPDFVGFNYDCFQSLIRSSIIINYPQYFKSLINLNNNQKIINQTNLKSINLKNIFTNDTINNPDNLTLMIYSTFLMTKAPYQKAVERANNLKGILKIHEQYSNEVGLDINQEEQFEKLSVICYDNGKDNFDNYTERLFSCDFNFDPKYCANLGIFANSYLKNRNLKDKMHSEWLRIVNNSWDTLATSTGLRGDKNTKNDFWGQKGYFVVYRNLANIPDYIKDTKEILCVGDLTDDERRRKLRKLNRLYLNELNNDLNENESEKGLIFHVVDKVQWKGSREIYVMDLNTKKKQQPIEQFMGFLCKNIENELISIPSDRRAQVIHHSIFEKDLPLKDIMTWYLTLDCTKWAPKSIFVKFAIMILNMEIIPSSFKTHFLNYLDKLYKKKVYFNKSEVEVLKNNPGYVEIVNRYLIEDKNVGGYFMYMPYSWVMGIFNYTSSFMHAINQMYASYLIGKSSLENLNEDVSLTMFAHSDDSGGRLSCRNKSIAQRCIMLYEVNLKCSNHLISRKKSVISKIYFEILSIIYLFKKLLALLPKFLGGLRFLPTDKGPCQDLLQSYSKCNEVMVAGANFSIAYIVMKMVSMLIWRFYFKRNPIASDYDRPVQYLGLPDAHPLMVLISGSDSDIIRLISIEKGEKLKSQINLVNSITESIDEPGPIRPFKYNIKVRNIGKNFEKENIIFEEEMKKWSIKNVNFKSTPFNMLGFLAKLKDTGFVGSMMNESTTRRLSRCYYMRSNDSLLTKNGMTSSENMVIALEKITHISGNEGIGEMILNTHYKNNEDFWQDYKENIPAAETHYKVLLNVLSGPLKICNYLDKLTLEGREFRKIDRTLKPTHIQLYKTGKCFSVDFDPAQLVAYIKKDNYVWAMPGIKRIETASIELRMLCKNLNIDIEKADENTLLKLCRNYSTKNVKDIYIYSQIPSDIRSIKTYSAFLSFIATNSFNGIEIGGLTLNLGNRMNDPAYVLTQIEDEIYTNGTILTLIMALLKEGRNFVNSLTLKSFDTIGWAGGTVLEYMLFLKNQKYSNPDYTLLKIQTEYIINELTMSNINCEDILSGSSYYTFTKNQKSKSGWRGNGEILICVGEDYFLFKIYNDKLIKAQTNRPGKVNKTLFSFVSDTLFQNNIRIDPNSLNRPNLCKTKFVFGYDYSGDISVCSKRECSTCIECEVCELRAQFLNDLPFSTIKHVRNDLFVLETQIDFLKKSTKIKCLRPKNSEFATTASFILDKNDFEKKLNEMGLNSLEDFIYTELLVDLGSEVQVKFDEFYDNFNSSKLYKIIKTVNDYDDEYIPKRIQTSQVPASKGGLFRIFIEYKNITGLDVVKTPDYITPEILAIRNEYPEKFSLILRDKMKESYENLFNSSEKNEMYEAYMQIIESDDINILRPKIINLMCYWGYDSLVNSLNLFTFNKSKENFKTFSMSGPDTKEISIFSSMFCKVIDKTINCLRKYKHLYGSLDYPISALGLNNNSVDIDNLPMSLSYTLFTMEVRQLNGSLPFMLFYNLLLALLKDEDFCNDLQAHYKEIPAISTLQINYENRHEFLATLNVLKYSWIEVNKIGRIHLLDPTIKMERLPVNVPQPAKFAKELKLDLNMTENIYHHGFLNSIFYNEINFNKYVTFRLGETNYRIKQGTKRLSDFVLEINKFFKFKGQLEDDFFDDENYEDFECELQTPDNELEDIQGFIDDVNLEIKYKPNETRITHHKGSIKTVDALINWVIHPGGEGCKNSIKRVNQTSENVIFLSDCFHYPILHLRNGFARLVDLSPFCGKKVPLMIAHVIHSKKLNKEFWDYYLPGQEFLPINKMSGILDLEIVRDVDYGLKDIWCLGKTDLLDVFAEKSEIIVEQENEDEKNASSSEVDPIEFEYDRALDYIEMFKSSGEISFSLANELELKYKKLKDDFKNLSNKPKKLDIFSLMKDLKIDTLMKLVKNDILLDLNKEQINKIMQSPEHFGISHGMSDLSERHVKDKHVKAELDSIEKDLMMLISSGNLTMSKNIKSLCKSSFRLWNQSVKRTDFKKEQKNFLLTVFLSLVSDSSLVNDEENDDKWQRIINRVQIKIAEENEENDSDDDEHKFNPNLSPSSRLFYWAVNS